MQIKKLFTLFSLCFVCLTAGSKGWYYQNIAAPEGLSDGFEFCSIAKQDPALSRIPFILLTARVEAKSRDRGLSLGADAYLPKPFENELLVKTVNELMGKASS